MKISPKLGSGLVLVGKLALFLFLWGELELFLASICWDFFPTFYNFLDHKGIYGILIGVCSIASFSVLGIIFIRLDQEVHLAPIGCNQESLPQNILKGFAWGALAQLLYFIAIWLGGFYRIIGHYSWINILVTLICSLLIAIPEEVAFRGYLLQRLETHYGTFLALVISSIAFGVWHIFWNGWHSLYYVIGTILLKSALGFMFGAAFLHSRNLGTSIGLHWGWNYIAFSFSDAYVQMRIPSFFQVTAFSKVFTLNGFSFWIDLGMAILIGVSLWITRKCHTP